jgi:formylglycine-generating enzyme required for sulfatase activity/class 3 adenylate cyclase
MNEPGKPFVGGGKARRLASSEEGGTVRRLAAIICADIVDYSRLMERNEEGTHARVKSLLRDTVNPVVLEHRGRILKNMGDGFLAMFDSPLEAVRCAIVIQQSMATRNLTEPQDLKMQYRIGVNLGDVILDQDDIFGDGVNVAARLQRLCAPGDVYISGGIYEQVKNKLVVGYQSLGDEKLKNITDPVHIYRVLTDPSAFMRTQRKKRGGWLVSIVAAVGVIVVGLAAWAVWRSANPFELQEPRPRQQSAMPPSTSPIPAPPVNSRTAESSPASSPTAPAKPAEAVPTESTPRNGEQRGSAPAAPELTPPAAVPRVIQAPSGPPALEVPPAPTPVPPASNPEPARTETAKEQTGPAPALGAKSQPINFKEPFRDCANCPEMTAITPGSFEMGSNDVPYAKPLHRVVISKPFAIGRREVTFDEWDACVGDNACTYHPADRGWGRGDRPVIDVSWNDAKTFIAWLSQKAGQKYRLPTEAEWEYAARAGATTAYYWGRDALGGQANCENCAGPQSRRSLPVGSFPPNAFGLFDTAGNAAEWVEDCWNEGYRDAPRDGSAWVHGQCELRVLRGGSFASNSNAVRLAARFRYDRDVRFYTNGFRVVRELP